MLIKRLSLKSIFLALLLDYVTLLSFEISSKLFGTSHYTLLHCFRPNNWSKATHSHLKRFLKKIIYRNWPFNHPGAYSKAKAFGWTFVWNWELTEKLKIMKTIKPVSQADFWQESHNSFQNSSQNWSQNSYFSFYFNQRQVLNGQLNWTLGCLVKLLCYFNFVWL